MIFKKKKLCIFKLNEYNFGLYPDLGGKKILKESGSTSIWVKLLNLELCKLKKTLLNVYNRHLAHITFHDSNSIVIQSPQKNQGTPTTSDDVDVYKGCIICDADSFLYYNSFFLYKLYIIPYNHETATDERSGRDILR
ncbi:unnamed protein product [Rhizophagus irregularis]|nr:unnamed protein product [Rhizophagus irregularis]CAB5360345.1 unnamed protein product [Rhizophagus irregularis]